MPDNSVNRKSNDSNVESRPTFGPTPAARGCERDTDGDGNCPVHPAGCPSPAEAHDNALTGFLIRLAFKVPRGTELGPDSELGGSLARYAEAIRAHERSKLVRGDADSLMLQLPRIDGRLDPLAVHDLVARLAAEVKALKTVATVAEKVAGYLTTKADNLRLRATVDVHHKVGLEGLLRDYAFALRQALKQ